MKHLRHVFCVVTDCHAESGHYRSLWQRHFYDGLAAVVERMVVPEQVDFGWARRGESGARPDNPQQRDRSSEQLLAQILRAHEAHGLEAVLSYCFAHDLNPAVVREVTARGVPWVNFFCDSTYRFDEVEALARIVTLNWFVERAALPSYRALGVPFVCLPYALNPLALPECACQRPQRAAAFIGMPTGQRVRQLAQLLAAGCNLEVRGPGWEMEKLARWMDSPAGQAMGFHGLGRRIWEQPEWAEVCAQAEGPLSDEELPGYLRGCRVVLGLNQALDHAGQAASYLKLRDLEFPGHGCCYLTEHNTDVAAALDVGREVLTYHTLDEAAELLRELARQPERAARLGVAGRHRVLAEHTWAARLPQLAAAL